MKAFVHLLYMKSAYGLTFLRLITGAILLYAGYRKIFAMDWAVYFFESRGVPFPHLVGPIISILELAGGAMLLAGLFTRYLAVIFTMEFAVAALITATSRTLVTARFELTILTAMIVIATQGAGKFAIDRSGRPWEPITDRRAR